MATTQATNPATAGPWLSEQLFDQILDVYRAEGRVPPELIARAEAAHLPTVLPMRALQASIDRQWDRCMDLGLEFFRLQPVLPNRFIGMLADAATRCDRKSELSWPILHFAEQAAREGRDDLALDAVKNLYSFSGDFTFIAEAKAVLRVAALLESIAARLPATPPRTAPAAGRPRVAMVCVNLVDQVLAYSKRAMQFVRYVDRSRYTPYLYLCETTSAARPQEFSIRLEQPPSTITGREYLAEIVQTGLPVRLAPPLPMTRLARWLAARMEQDLVDAVIFQGGVNAVDMWLAARISAVPVKVNLCLGINMYQPGMQAAIYDNQDNLARESAFWQPDWGRQILLPWGVDLREADAAPRPAREDLDIPSDAVVFGLLSNYVQTRVTPAYMRCVAEVLRACPNAWFLCMGAGDNTIQQNFFRQAGLEKRCRWLGQQKRPYSALKRLDFYYNEFPIGGCSVVREAMACGVPALAMRYSEKHHESAAAAIIGAPFALEKRDPDEYVRRAIAWVNDAEQRTAAGVAMRERARRDFSAEKCMRQLCDLLHSDFLNSTAGYRITH